jgi:hypothetical protein
LERGERTKKRVKEWGSPWGLLGGGVLLQGGTGLLLCTWFPTAREEGNTKKEKRREDKEEKKEKRKEGKNEKKEKKERNFFPNMEISEKIKDTL